MNEIKKVTLTAVYRNTTDKAGNPLKSAKGIPYTKLSFKCKEYGDKYVGGFGNKANESWKQGDTVEVIIKENGQYLNFEMPKEVDMATERITKLEARVTTLDLSLERRVRELFSELKSDLVLELTGKFQTTKDYERSQEPHPILQSSNPLDGVAPDEDVPF